MLTSRELATLRAALRYWQEEICPHGPAAARLYLDSPASVPLTSTEVRRLRDRFRSGRVRYCRCRRARSYVLQGPLFRSTRRARPGEAVATVLLPTAVRPR